MNEEELRKRADRYLEKAAVYSTVTEDAAANSRNYQYASSKMLEEIKAMLEATERWTSKARSEDQLARYTQKIGRRYLKKAEKYEKLYNRKIARRKNA